MTKVINISMPEELVEEVNRRARQEDRSRSSLFREALRLYFASVGEQEEARKRVHTVLGRIRRRVARGDLTERDIDERIADAVAAVRSSARTSRPGSARKAR